MLSSYSNKIYGKRWDLCAALIDVLDILVHDRTSRSWGKIRCINYTYLYLSMVSIDIGGLPRIMEDKGG